MRIIAFITEAAMIRAIPGHLGQPLQLPRLRPARRPPLWGLPDQGRTPSIQAETSGWPPFTRIAGLPQASSSFSSSSGALIMALWPVRISMYFHCGSALRRCFKPMKSE